MPQLPRNPATRPLAADIAPLRPSFALFVPGGRENGAVLAATSARWREGAPPRTAGAPRREYRRIPGRAGRRGHLVGSITPEFHPFAPLDGRASRDGRAPGPTTPTTPRAAPPSHSPQRALRHQARGELEEVDGILADWSSRHGRGEQWTVLRNRQAVLWHARDPSRAVEMLREATSPCLTHQRAGGDDAPRGPPRPTRLDPALVSAEALARRARGGGRLAVRGAGLRHFAAAAGDLDASRSDGRRPLLQAFLKGLERPDAVPDLPALVEKGLRAKDGGSFGAHAVHPRMLTAQLDALARRMPELWRSEAFVAARVARMRPGEDSCWDAPATAADLDERRGYLEALWGLAGPLEPAFSGLKQAVLFHLLEMGTWGGPAAMRASLPHLCPLLALPRAAGWARADRVALLRSKGVPVLPAGGAPAGGAVGAAGLAPVTAARERELVDAYLALCFEADCLAEATVPASQVVASDRLLPLGRLGVEAFVGEAHLRQAEARAKLLRGIGDADRWAAELGASELEALRGSAEVTLTPQNRRFYAAGDPVELFAEVRNVASLTVQVFEVSQAAFWLSRGREVDVGIDLDGLVAQHRRVVEVGAGPLRRVPVRLPMPELGGAGCFVVELIGGGRSSRALVRKGRLRLVESPDAAGHALTVLDERGERAEGAHLLLEGRRYDPGADGTIRVPYTASRREKRGLLVRGPVATPAALAHLEEAYELAGDMFVDREQLVEGADATVCVRASLLLNGVDVSEHLAELAPGGATLTVTTTDRAGVSSESRAALALRAGREATHTFRVPAGLARVDVRLEARVAQATTGREVALSASRAYEVNGIDAGGQLADLHLAWTRGGFVLHVLGKGGERRAGREVALALAHTDFSLTTSAVLQTDAAGRVELGALAGVESVTATCGGARRTFAVPPPAAVSLPAAVHAPAGETVRVGWPGGAGEAAGAALPGPWELSLLRRCPVGPGFDADCSGSLELSGGVVSAAGLAPGTYSLWMAPAGRAGQEVTVRVAAAPGGGGAGGDGGSVGCTPAADGWVVTPRRCLEDTWGDPLQVSAARVAADGSLEVEVSNVSAATRVHAFATRFVPPFRAWDDLGGGRAPTAPPRVAEAPARAPSEYQSGRTLGEEHDYILRRREGGRRFPGNMLPRPSLLVHPWAVRKTDTARQDAAAGDQFCGAPAPPPCAAPRARCAAAPRATATDAPGFSNLDFLATPGRAALNLPVDEAGRAAVPASLLSAAGANMVTVVAVDGRETAMRVVPLDEWAGEDKDLRLFREALDPTKHFVERRRASVLRPEGGGGGSGGGGAVRIGDISTADVGTLGSLPAALALLTSLVASPAAASKLREFEFVGRWGGLAEGEKLRLYSRHACHELHLFLFLKDRGFFDRVVLDALRCKSRRTFLDDYLVAAAGGEGEGGAGVEGLARRYYDPAALRELNAAERVLLARAADAAGGAPGRLEAERKRIAAHVLAHPVEPAREERLFSAVLAAGSLSGDDALGMEEAKMALRELQEKEEAEDVEADWEVVAAPPGLGSRAGGPPGGGYGGPPGAGAGGGRPGRGRGARAGAAMVRSLMMDGSLDELEGGGDSGTDFGPSSDADELDDELLLAEEEAEEEAPRASRMKKKAARPKPMGGAGGGPGGLLGLRKEVKPLWRAPDATEELAENHYHHLPLSRQGPGLVEPNAFWLDFAAWGAGAGGGGFASANLVHAHGSFTEVLMALAVTDLAFEAPRLSPEYEGRALTLRITEGRAPVLAFCREIAQVGGEGEGEGAAEGAVEGGGPAAQVGPLLVSQRLLRSDDMFVTVEGQQLHRYADPGEVLVGVEYQAHVVVTNPTAAVRKLGVLMQVRGGGVGLGQGGREPTGPGSSRLSAPTPGPERPRPAPPPCPARRSRRAPSRRRARWPRGACRWSCSASPRRRCRSPSTSRPRGPSGTSPSTWWSGAGWRRGRTRRASRAWSAP